MSIRSVIALASKNGLKLHQMDVATAFLNGELKEEVYTQQPKGFVIKGQEHLVCRLKKNLYGLKQSPRCWIQALHAQLTEMRFKQTPSDPLSTRHSQMVYLFWLFTWMMMAGKSAKKMTQVKGALARQFQVKDLGELHYFLGVSVKQSSESGHTWICQPAYIQSILKKFGLEQRKPANTPVTPGTKLLKVTNESQLVDATLSVCSG